MSEAIAIIIPNYNGAHLLARNLPSVLTSIETDELNATVIVVDDGSTDASLQVLQDRFPAVRVVAHPINRGFSEAIWSGVQAADTELVFLLNSDVELKAGCLKRLVPYYESPDTFAVCPLILDEDGSVNRHSWNQRRFQWGNLKAVEWELSSAREARQRGWLATLYTSGGSMMVRRSMFIALNGFHPIFKPFYGEDYDLGLRAWRQGWSSYFEPGASVVHQSRGSIKDHVKRAYVKQVRRRNKYLLEWIHLPALRLWTGVIPWSLWQLLGEVILLDRVNLKGFGNAVLQLGSVMRARRIVQRTAKLSFTEVLQRSRQTIGQG
jgi:GT2 family glycosyltransferase